MQFGVMAANVGRFARPAGARAMGQAAEAAGMDSVWTVEHVLVPDGYESTYPYDPSGRMPGAERSAIPDPLIWLTYVAAVTERLKLATGILIVPQRNPAVVAKEIATLDQLAEGRLLLGVGAGWLEEEFDALKVPFADRGQRLEEYIAAMRALWTEEKATVHSSMVDLEAAISLPKPAQGSVPVIVGGHSNVAARRAGRIGDGFFPGRAGDRLAELIGIMRAAAEEAGRDPDGIEITAMGVTLGEDPKGGVAEMAALGVHRILVPPLTLDLDGLEDAFGAFLATVGGEVD